MAATVYPKDKTCRGCGGPVRDDGVCIKPGKKGRDGKPRCPYGKTMRKMILKHWRPR